MLDQCHLTPQAIGVRDLLISVGVTHQLCVLMSQSLRLFSGELFPDNQQAVLLQ